MLDTNAKKFAPLNRGFARTFKAGGLTIGLVVPLERYDQSAVPTMARHLDRARLADELGFAALWLRDVPFNVPSFGDAGQIFDPFVYLGLLSAATKSIALGTASIILPLRHPAHVAKAAASADQLSNGRLLLGVASGDRPEEYPAMNMEFESRGERFRDSLRYIRSMADSPPKIDTAQGVVAGMDMLPKPTADRLPLLITGSSRQSPDWTAEHGDGWITYPRAVPHQARAVADYRRATNALGHGDKPVMQSLYVDLASEPSEPPSPIHLGFRSGATALTDYLTAIEDAGVNHVALNLRFNQANIEDTLQRLADALLPRFLTGDT